MANGIRLFLGKLFGGKDEPEQYLSDEDYRDKEHLYNKEAIDQAIKKAEARFPELTEEQKAALSQVVTAHMETSGVTLGDVMESLGASIDEQRAEEIAQFMITTSYADREDQEGKRLQEEFSDVPVVKEWFTCNDHHVCDVCKSNEDIIVLSKNPFPSGHMKPPGCDDCRCDIHTSTDISEVAVLWEP